MSTHLYNELEIKASHEDMRSLLKKVVNQNNNKFELKSNVWEVDSAACHSWDDGDECNYELTRNGDEMILRADFISKNVPPYYWAEKLVQQLPEISFTMFSTAFNSPNFLIRYSRESGLVFMKNYRLLINWLDCVEVATNETGQYCYVLTGEPLNDNLIPNLIRVRALKYVKENLTYFGRLYLWLLKRKFAKIEYFISDIKRNGLKNTWKERKILLLFFKHYCY